MTKSRERSLGAILEDFLIVTTNNIGKSKLCHFGDSIWEHLRPSQGLNLGDNKERTRGLEPRTSKYVLLRDSKPLPTGLPLRGHWVSRRFWVPCLFIRPFWCELEERLYLGVFGRVIQLSSYSAIAQGVVQYNILLLRLNKSGIIVSQLLWFSQKIVPLTPRIAMVVKAFDPDN